MLASAVVAIPAPSQYRSVAKRKWLAVPVGKEPATLTARMRRKIDQGQAQKIYSRRLAIVEPVFANLRSNKGLDRFTYRGQVKVNIQWLLYCLVHNIEKIAHYGKNYRTGTPSPHLRRFFCHLWQVCRRSNSLLRTFYSLFLAAPDDRELSLTT